MYALNPAPKHVEGVLREHVARASELLAELRLGFSGFHDIDSLRGVCRRCAANLDALRVAGAAAIAIARTGMGDDSDVASVVAWLLAECEENHGEAEQAVAMLRHESADIRQAAWFGLRLADPSRSSEHLRTMAKGPARDIASAAARDVLAFHRQAVQLDPSTMTFSDNEDVEWLLAEAAGRVPGAWNAADLQRSLGHASRRVKEAALRASARSGLAELAAVCRDAANRATSPEAIEFLGVVGSHDDLARLQHVATGATRVDAPIALPIAKAGVVALGRLGLVGAMPTLLYLLDEPGLGETAALAIVRITGDGLPRGTVPDPPRGLSEDELDLWEPVAPVDAPRAREWWSIRAPGFDPKKRYQAGACVSDDPLDPFFDRLPPPIRNDVYLRQRALVAGTPDWELETWTWKQKNPGGWRESASTG